MGEARPDQAEIDIPGAKRTAVANLVPSSPHDDGPGLRMVALGGKISPEKPVIRWMSDKQTLRVECVCGSLV